MTFDHLDDPNPPRPSDLVVARIAAEGGRRLRYRRVVGGAAAALLVVLGSVGVVSQLDNGKDRVVISPSGSTSSTTSPDGEGERSEDAFAAIIQVQDQDVAQVVLASARTGEVTRVLAEFPLFSQPWLCCVAWAPDRQTVFFVKPAGDYGAGQETDTIWEVPASGNGEPERVGEGYAPSISPEGDSLVYIRPLTSDGDELVVRDLSSRQERSVRTPAGRTLGSVAFSGAGSVIFTLAAAGRPETGYLLGLDDSDISIDDARRLGPPEDAPTDTGWSSAGAHPAEGTATFVERCCQTGDVADSATFILIDTASGERLDSVVLPRLAVAAPSSPSGNSQLFLLPPADTDLPNLLLIRTAGSAPAPVPVDAATVIAVDW